MIFLVELVLFDTNNITIFVMLTWMFKLMVCPKKQWRLQYT